MKKYMKIIYVLLIVLTIFITFDKVYAVPCDVCGGDGYIGDGYSIPCTKCGTKGQIDSQGTGSIVSGGNDFISMGENSNSPIKTPNMQELSSTIYNILLTIGIIIAFIVGGILGIQFITGGIEGQVEVKKALVPYILGCVVIFGAFTIWKVVLTILQ